MFVEILMLIIPIIELIIPIFSSLINSIENVELILTIFSLIGIIGMHILTLKKSNQIQQDLLMHDMVKEEISNWKDINKQNKKSSPESVNEHIFNYYEYLAYLILEGKINEKYAKDIWKPNILNVYNDFKKEFLGNRTELKKLVKIWKK